MLTGSKSSSKTKRMFFGLVLLVLLCAAIALGFANKHFSERKATAGSADIPVRNERAARKSERAGARYPDRMSALAAVPQSSAQFDLLRNVIAGGGGTRSAGSFSLDGTVGQPAAGTIMSGGNFAQAGGFWYAITSGAPPSPTATPTPDFIVNSTDDAVDVNPGDGICETAAGNGVCTLRAAIKEASSGNTIGFSLPAGSTIKLTNGELLIDKNLTINGPGANVLTVARSSDSGTQPFRIFDIVAGTVTLSGFTISNGVGVSPNVF